MPEARLVHAWRLGYNYGRAEAQAECDCQPEPEPGNLRFLDDYRRESFADVAGTDGLNRP